MKLIAILNKWSWITLLLLLSCCSEEPVDELGSGTITGIIVSLGDNKPLANVKVETSPVSNTVFTDQTGAFAIVNVPGGEYSVKAQHQGYTTAFKAAAVQSSRTSHLVFEMAVSNANNKPPQVPLLLAPLEAEVLKSTEVIFKWSAKDPDKDVLKFTLELHNDLNSDIAVFENIPDTTFTYKGLQLGVKYFWQISATDGINNPVKSALKTFTVFKAPISNRLLFTRLVKDKQVIYSTDDQGNAFELTSLQQNSFRPKLNLAAKKIAYFQTNGAQCDIFIMNRDGSNKQQLTSFVKPNGFNWNEISFCWPANSDKIYFPTFNKLYRINTNGQGLELIYETADGSLISEVDVNESNGVIALKTNQLNGYQVKIFSINFRGEVLYTALSNVPGAASGLQLSDDAKQLLYSHDISGFQSPGYIRKTSRLFIYDVVAKTKTNISSDTPAGTSDLDPRFAPNGVFVVFVNTSSDGMSQRNIYQKDPSNAKRELLVKDGLMAEWK